MNLEYFDSKGQFPDAWRVGDLLFISGQVAVGPDGDIIGKGDIAEQTRVAFRNMEAVLQRAGYAFSDLVKLNTFIHYDGPEAEFPEFWKRMDMARRPFLGAVHPTATAVRVSGFALAGLLIEIDGIAVRKTAD